MIGGSSGFEAQFQEFMFYAGSIIQLLYYTVLPLMAIWAVLLFKRLVDFRTGSGKFASAGGDAVAADAASDMASDADADVDASAPEEPAEKPIRVEKFVE